MTSAMDMTDLVVQDMLAEDRREALARIRGAVPSPNELTKILADAVAPFGCFTSYEHTGGNCGAVGVYRSDADGMREPVGAYLLVGGSEGPWPYSSGSDALDVQWSDDDPDPDWDSFGVYLYSDTVEAFTVAAVSGVADLVVVVAGWARGRS